MRLSARNVSLAVVAASSLVIATVANAGTPTRVRFATTELPKQGSYGEPSIALTQDGKHIAVCVPGGNGTYVWYSSDKGQTFGKTKTSSANGGGDCELDFLPNGTLLMADLEVSDSNVKISHDFGQTFDAGRSVGIEQDRQWFAHSADGKTAYLVYHDFVAEGEFYARSTDGGLTWPKSDAANPVNGADQVTAPGSALTPAKPGGAASIVDQGGNTFSGPMLISPNGQDQYVLYSISDIGSNTVGTKTPPYGATRGIVVAHKGPQEQFFTNKYAITSNGTVINGAIFPWGSIDKAGNVYVFYNSDAGAPGHFHMYYVVSKDHARSWSNPVKVDDVPLNQGAQIYATGQAGADGVIDVAWYGSSNASSPADNLATWKVYFAQVRGATSAHPSIQRARVADKPNHHGNICLNGLLCLLGGDRSLADFFELAIGPDGAAQIAYADNYETGGEVIYARQTTGRSAWVK